MKSLSDQYNQVQRFYTKSKQLQSTGYSTTVECTLLYSTTKEFKHDNTKSVIIINTIYAIAHLRTA